MDRRMDGGSVDVCMYTHMNGYVEKRQWIQVIKRQISYRIIKQVAHFQMSYVNTADGVVSIKKDPIFSLHSTTRLQLERLDE